MLFIFILLTFFIASVALGVLYSLAREYFIAFYPIGYRFYILTGGILFFLLFPIEWWIRLLFVFSLISIATSYVKEKEYGK